MRATRRKMLSILIGSTFLCATVVSDAEARNRGVGIAAGIIGAGIIGAAIGSAIAHRHHSAPARAKKRGSKRRSNDSQNADRRKGSNQGGDDQGQASERTRPVAIVQYALSSLGFYDGPPTDRMTKDTAVAIARWQSKKGDEATGQLTDKQFERLRQVIVEIQQRLDRLGFDPGPSDGNVTQRLRQAVQRFQTKLGVRADGYLSSKEDDVLRAMDTDRMVTLAMDQVFEKIANSNGLAPSGGSAPKEAESKRVAAAELASFRVACRKAAPQSAFSLSVSPTGEAGDTTDEFCQMRSQAMADGTQIFKTLVSHAKTITPDMVRAECARFAESKRQEIDALKADDPGAIVSQLAKIRPANDRQREIAVNNAKICLGYGYTDDKPEVVLGSTLFLLGLGETGYGEVVAGHFALGVGEPKNSAKAAAWLEYTARELEAGKAGIVKADGSGRAKTLRQVSEALKNSASAEAPDVGFGPQFMSAGPSTGAGAGASPRTSDLPPYAAELTQNVVYIFTGEATGTGFFIAPNLILTNDHVAGKANRVLVASKVLPLNVQAGKVLYRGRVGGSADALGIDAAIIEVEKYRHPTFLKFAQDAPAVTTFVAAGGFPGRSLGEDRGKDDFFKVILQGNLPTSEQLPHMTISTGNVQSYFQDKRSGRERMQQSAQTSHGSSGSPIVNACGEVVALLDSGSTQSIAEVVKQGYVEGTDFIWTYAAAEVLKFMKSVKLEPQIAGERCTAGSGTTVH